MRSGLIASARGGGGGNFKGDFLQYLGYQWLVPGNNCFSSIKTNSDLEMQGSETEPWLSGLKLI